MATKLWVGACLTRLHAVDQTFTCPNRAEPDVSSRTLRDRDQQEPSSGIRATSIG
jgi:hypothetical protein